MAEKCTSAVKQSSIITTKNSDQLLSNNEFNKATAEDDDTATAAETAPGASSSILATVKTNDQHTSSSSTGISSNQILPNLNDSVLSLSSSSTTTTTPTSSLSTNATVAVTIATAAASPSTATTTPTGYLIKECETEDNCNDDDNGKECKESHIHCEKVDNIYLETPVLDDNNELMIMMSAGSPTTTTTTAVTKQMVEISTSIKPKRLSDEFFSADDGEYDDDDDGKRSVTVAEDRPKNPTNIALPIDTEGGGDGGNDEQTCYEENSTDNLITRTTAYIEDELSSCSNLMDISNEHDDASPHSSVSPTVMNLTDDGDEANHGDEHNNHHMDNIFYANDVQSMDAIERKDFINEQKLTGGIILKGSSLISNNSDNRLNIGLLNTFSQKIDSDRVDRKYGGDDDDDEDDDDDDDDDGKNGEIMDASSAADKDKLSTTPTSSRMETLRSIGNAARAAARKSQAENRLERHVNAAMAGIEAIAKAYTIKSEIVNINNRLGTNSSIGESSVSASSSQQQQPQQQQQQQQPQPDQFADAFMNSNSSDSLLSDKSCRIAAASYSCSNSSNFEFSHASTSERTIAGTAKVAASSTSTSLDCAATKSCCNQNVQLVPTDCCPDGAPSTSKAHVNSSSTCQYSNPNSSAAAAIDENDIKQESNEMNMDEDIQIVVPEIDNQPRDNYDINDLPLSASNNHHHHHHQSDENSFNQLNSLDTNNDYDDDTWADCEDSYDAEEVCTCQDYSDEETHGCSEDELPSRDVDLSGYTHLDSISEDILQEGTATETPVRNYRKRKITETRSHCADANGSGNTSSSSSSGAAGGDTTPGNRKRLALDGSRVVSPKLPCTPSTPTLTTTATITSPSSSSVVNSLGLALSEKRCTPRSIIPTRDNPPPELSDWLLQFQRWSHAERLLAVDRLIEHCEPTQVRHMMKVIEPQFQRDFISLLPKELALQVLSFLDPKDLLRAAQTCRSWRFLCDDNLLWKEKCKKTGIIIEPNTDRPKRGRAGNMPPISSPWKAAYMRQHIIEMNWRSRPIRNPKVLKGHDDHVITCLQFCGNRIVSGSDDNTLKVWSAITGKCLRTLVGHTGGVWSSQMSGNIIISGSTDRTLKVWNADSGLCNHTLYGHTSTVRCMHLHGRKVVSGSRDATLRVWDIAQGKCLHILVGHLAAVRCVQYDGKLVVSGAYDYMVKVWNPERQECLHTLQGHTNRVYSLQFDGVHVVSGSLDTSIRVWDAETGSCKHTLMGHQSLTSGMELRQNILVSGNADSTVKVWDITTGQCLQTLSGANKHQSAVTCLQFNSRFVVTSSDDGTVKLWDVRTGEFIRNLVALDSGGSGGVVWRIRANDTKLICAVGSRNGTEETKLMVLDFDVEGACLKCS